MNGICSDDPDAITKAHQQLREMMNKSTEIIIKRGYLLEIKNLYVNSGEVSGLGIASFKDYEVSQPSDF